jgi:hypothetical protein
VTQEEADATAVAGEDLAGCPGLLGGVLGARPRVEEVSAKVEEF